jgi:glycerol-3-phosphate dehydrogenase
MQGLCRPPPLATDGAYPCVSGHMQLLSAEARADNIRALDNAHVDVLVIGGGITGAGVALDAVSRGYSVALIEKSDFASGTSSKSTKLVHGGIRYLPNFDFGLVHEALVERGLLLQNAPYLVHPINFILPIYEGDRHPVGMPITTPNGVGLNRLLDAGLYIYDGMAGRRNVGRHHHLTREQVLERAPLLHTKGLKEGFTYYDAQTNDARLTMAVIRTAARFGAIITNYTAAISFVKDKNNQLNGVNVKDTLNDQQFTVYARHIVNATGVYAEKIEALAGVAQQIEVEPSKGVHLVLSKEKLKLGNDAIVLPETHDKRILFIVPWESRAIYGTTDTGTGDLDHPTATSEDVTYLLTYLNRYLSAHFSEDDIISTYAGYRPLVKPRNGNAATAKLSRTHAVLQSPSGLITITGGKLTTYRRMAQDTVDVISKRDDVKPVHTTQSLPLLGSAAWPHVKQELERRAAELELSAATIHHLGHFYGSGANTILDMIEHDRSLGQLLIADLPYIQAEALYAMRYEMAMTPADILSRRTSIVLEDHQRGLGIVDTIAEMMAKELNWTPTTRDRLVRAYREKVEGQMLAEQR